MRRIMKGRAGIPVLLALSGSVSGGSVAQDRPNVIFFLVDDMGWMDSSLYGSTFYQTPAMERLAKSAVRFTNAYSASPLCSPARASIMSGQYPARHGMTTALGHQPIKEDDPDYQIEKLMTTPDRIYPASRKVLAVEQYTLAEAFRDAGYRTGFVGKWHMGHAPEYWPDQQGFEFTFKGTPDSGPPSYFSPYRFRMGNVTDGPAGEYITDRATTEALKYIHNGDERPFFLCLWHWAVHTPFQAKDELIEYYRNHPDPQGRQLSPTMAAMLHSMDESLGHLLDDLERSGLDKNTILVFTSDNGGLSNRPVPADGGVPATNNDPLHKGKASLFEGGSRVPALVRWPGITDEERVSDAVITGVDFYPTLLEMCGIPPNPDQVIDGISFVSVLKGASVADREIYCFFPHNFSEYSPAGAWIRQGDWKLIEVFYISDIWPEKYLLYNLKEDIGEKTNLAAKHPERTAAMAEKLETHYMTLCDRPPIPNPAFDESTLPVGGWLSQGNGLLKITDEGLQVHSPGIRTRGLPREAGRLKLAWRMRTRRADSGRVFWSGFSQRPYDPERSAGVAIRADGEWHEYSVEFETADDLYGLRMDLGVGSSPVELESIRLFGQGGDLLAHWHFQFDETRK
jgi:arylsulfatase A-like enzyme